MPDDPQPEFTEKHLLHSLFDPALQREVEDFMETLPPVTPLDLRTVPREDWDNALDAPLVFPPDVATYLDGILGERPLTVTEIDHIEKRMNTFYATLPEYIVSVSTRGVPSLIPNTEGFTE